MDFAFFSWGEGSILSDPTCNFVLLLVLLNHKYLGSIQLVEVLMGIAYTLH